MLVEKMAEAAPASSLGSGPMFELFQMNRRRKAGERHPAPAAAPLAEPIPSGIHPKKAN